MQTRAGRRTRARRRGREWGSGARRSKMGPTPLDPMVTPPRGIGVCPPNMEKSCTLLTRSVHATPRDWGSVPKSWPASTGGRRCRKTSTTTTRTSSSTSTRATSYSIIPGRIRPTKGSKQRIRLEIKYSTGTGLKALAKTGTAVQEVFFVTARPDAVRERLLSAATDSDLDA